MLIKLAWLFAILLVLIGIFGFIPGITTNGYLLRVFEVDVVHNIIHIVSGLAFFFAARKSAIASKRMFQIFGVVYGLVALIGILQGDTVLGLFAVNLGDHVLHVLIAGISLFIGFKKENLPAVV